MNKLTRYPMQRENKRVTLNQVIKVSQPCTVRQAAISLRAFAPRNGIFTLAFPLYCLFYGGQGQGGFMPDGLTAITANLAFCSPPLRFAAKSGVLRTTVRKGKNNV